MAQPTPQERPTKEALTVSMAQANLFALLMIVPVGTLGVIYGLLWGGRRLFEGFLALDLAQFLLVFIIGIVLHEAIHGLTWMITARKPARAIKVGFQLKTLTPYAHCREPMPVEAYRLGTMMPGLLLGLLPVIAGLVTGNTALMLFGLLFTLAAGGDALILWLLRQVKSGQWVEDHPTEAGCYVLDNRSTGG